MMVKRDLYTRFLHNTSPSRRKFMGEISPLFFFRTENFHFLQCVRDSLMSYGRENHSGKVSRAACRNQSHSLGPINVFYALLCCVVVVNVSFCASTLNISCLIFIDFFLPEHETMWGHNRKDFPPTERSFLPINILWILSHLVWSRK